MGSAADADTAVDSGSGLVTNKRPVRGGTQSSTVDVREGFLWVAVLYGW